MGLFDFLFEANIGTKGKVDYSSWVAPLGPTPKPPEEGQTEFEKALGFGGSGGRLSDIERHKEQYRDRYRSGNIDKYDSLVGDSFGQHDEESSFKSAEENEAIRQLREEYQGDELDKAFSQQLVDIGIDPNTLGSRDDVEARLNSGEGYDRSVLKFLGYKRSAFEDEFYPSLGNDVWTDKNTGATYEVTRLSDSNYVAGAPEQTSIVDSASTAPKESGIEGSGGGSDRIVDEIIDAKIDNNKNDGYYEPIQRDDNIDIEDAIDSDADRYKVEADQLVAEGGTLYSPNQQSPLAVTTRHNERQDVLYKETAIRNRGAVGNVGR